MNSNFDFNMNVVAIITSILAWGFIIFLAYRVYKKQTGRPKVWRILIVLFIGLFSFSINWNMFETILRLPILPLGVWILYFILEKRR